MTLLSSVGKNIDTYGVRDMCGEHDDALEDRPPCAVFSSPLLLSLSPLFTPTPLSPLALPSSPPPPSPPDLLFLLPLAVPKLGRLRHHLSPQLWRCLVDRLLPLHFCRPRPRPRLRERGIGRLLAALAIPSRITEDICRNNTTPAPAAASTASPSSSGGLSGIVVSAALRCPCPGRSPQTSTGGTAAGVAVAAAAFVAQEDRFVTARGILWKTSCFYRKVVVSWSSSSPSSCPQHLSCPSMCLISSLSHTHTHYM